MYNGHSDVLTQVQAIYGIDPWLALAQGIKSEGKGAGEAKNVLQINFGLGNWQQIAAVLKEAGYYRDDILSLVWKDYRGGGVDVTVTIMKELYGANDPSAMAVLLNNLRWWDGYPMVHASEAGVTLQQFFPAYSTGNIAMALKAAGYPVGEGGSEGIYYWLGMQPLAPNDSVASILGPAPGGLGLTAQQAGRLLSLYNYSSLQKATWMKSYGFNAVEIALYANIPTGAEIAMALKGAGFGIDEVTTGLLAYIGSRPIPVWLYSNVLSFLTAAGYDLPDIVGALGRAGASVENVIETIAASYSTGGGMSATEISMLVYDNMPRVTLGGIARGLYVSSVNTGEALWYFHRGEIYDAMKAINFLVIQRAFPDAPFSANEVFADLAAFRAIREAGLSVENAVRTAAELGWGMYTALVELSMAGYNIGDLVSAMWNE